MSRTSGSVSVGKVPLDRLRGGACTDNDAQSVNVDPHAVPFLFSNPGFIVLVGVIITSFSPFMSHPERAVVIALIATEVWDPYVKNGQSTLPGHLLQVLRRLISLVGWTIMANVLAMRAFGLEFNEQHTVNIHLKHLWMQCMWIAFSFIVLAGWDSYLKDRRKIAQRDPNLTGRSGSALP